ncbi:MAG: tetratricopeptide repeat protein [Cyanobacteria bacterium J06598_3]
MIKTELSVGSACNHVTKNHAAKNNLIARLMRPAMGWIVGSAATLTLVAGSSLSAQAAGPQMPVLPNTAATQLIAQADAYETLINQGQAQLDNRDYDAALATFGEAIDSEPNAARAWVGKGEALYGLRQFDEAAIAFTQATKLAPDYLYAWVWLGNAYDDAGQLDQSLASYAEAIAIDSTNPMPYYHRGIALWYADRSAEAETDLKLVTEIMPEFSRGWMWLGRSLEKQENYTEALAAYEQALSIDADLGQALFGKGTTLLEMDRYDEAIAPFDAFLTQMPDSAIAWFYRGNGLFGSDQYAEALASYDKSIEISADSEGPWYNRGLVLANLGRYDEAIESFNQVLAINPDNSGARQQIESLEQQQQQANTESISASRM